MAVGTYLGPKRVVVAFAEGAQQAGQPDEREIEPAKTLAVGGMAEFVLADLVGEDKCHPFAPHPTACPQVNVRAKRYTHAIRTIFLCSKSDATQRVDTVDLTSKCPHHSI